jgi:hypothetical protein
VVDKQDLTKSFDWAAVSSFVSDGKSMYCIYFEHANSIGRIVVTYIVLDQQKYADLKAAVEKKEGTMYQASSNLYDDKTSQTSMPQEIYNAMNATYKSTINYCLSVEAKKKVQFMMPGLCEKSVCFSGKEAHYYECDFDAFAKLLKLP